MLVTPEKNRRNRTEAIAVAAASALASICASWFWSPALLFLPLCSLIYWLLRRRCVRRLRIMAQPFPAAWEHILASHVAFFQALPALEKERFRQLIKVFLDEVRITGIGTEIDDTVRVLVAASAAIPIFGFHDWDYHRLGEVLVYPTAFGEHYLASKGDDANILGMVGLHQFRGVMILSKPSLLAGFETLSGRENVGIHEFAHLVELEENENGLPPEVPWHVVKHWVQYVARELSHPPGKRSSIRSYAYSNEHEFFAVLAEYFFTSPDLLKRKNPELYQMLKEVFHQDTASLLKRTFPRRLKYGRNAPCPCGSGKKYKRCCLVQASRPEAALANGQRAPSPEQKTG